MSRDRTLRAFEAGALLVGGLLLLVYVAARVDGYVHRRLALGAFAEAAESRQGDAPASPTRGGEVDTSLWSEGRIQGYEESLEVDVGRIVAILRIPKIGLEVPVFEGTDEITLNRGLGRIPGSARPGEGGTLASPVIGTASSGASRTSSSATLSSSRRSRVRSSIA
jgi:sortase A